MMILKSVFVSLIIIRYKYILLYLINNIIINKLINY